MRRLNTEGTLYEITIPHRFRDARWTKVIAALLDDMYRVAEDNQCLLEASFHVRQPTHTGIEAMDMRFIQRFRPHHDHAP